MKRRAAAWLAAASLAACSHPAPPHPPQPAAATQVRPPSPDAQLGDVLGTVVDQYFRMQRRLYEDEVLGRYVTRVGAAVAAGARAGRFQFDVVDDTEVNAWSIPGGMVHVSRGALAAMDAEAQLAAVIAHEVGHVVAGHSVQGFFASMLAPDTSQAATTLIDQEQEYQADRLGSRLLRAAGYDPRAAASMLERLHATAGEMCPQAPPLPTRLARLWRHLPRDAGGRVERDAYLDRIDGLVYGEDPRAGMLRGDEWVCVRCGFGLRAPPGWSSESINGTWSARAPSAECALRMQRVGEAGGAVARAYVSLMQSRAFTQQEYEGVRILSGTTQSKGDVVPAAVLQTESEVFLLVVSGPGAEQQLQQALRSVRRTSERDAPGPARIRVLPAAASGAFGLVARLTCGSSVPSGTLAVLNGRATTEQVEKGYRIKCVQPG